MDVQEIVIESGTHLAWSHVTWAYTSTWSEEVALFYALAWFDKYLAGDLARDGVSATQRVISNYESAESPGHGLSRKYLSAYSIGGELLPRPARPGDRLLLVTSRAGPRLRRQWPITRTSGRSSSTAR